MQPLREKLPQVAVAMGLVASLLAWSYVDVRSPAALWRADMTASFGHPVEAARIYDRIAAHNGSADRRQVALERSIALWSVDVGDAAQARERIGRLLERPLSEQQQAHWSAVLAELWLEDGDGAQAAEHWRKAHELDPEHPRAALRLASAANAAQQAENLVLSEQIWKQLAKEHPAYRGRALVERATLRLRLDDSRGAHSLYERAVSETFDPDVTTVARLGIATSLERLGALDKAIEAFDLASDLPSEVRARRTEAIRDRNRIR